MMDQNWWDELSGQFGDISGGIDRKIDETERAIGEIMAHAQVISTPGWETYREKLTEKFHGLVRTLARGINLSEPERFVYQGRIMELERVIADADDAGKQLKELQARLDQLRKERDTLKEQSQPQ